MSKRKTLTQSSLHNEKRARSDVSNDSADENNNRCAGNIIGMTLRNFMCHSLLQVDFKTNITFITGRNGSGKSAILTALVVGLGGRASITNRGTSAKGFIKAGKTSGSVQIEICNVGFGAYKPNVYGRTIVVQRYFTSGGSSAYKIKSETGEVISKQAKEVERIAHCLNIQIANPVCILNQDTSRNFLSTKNQNHKFELFVKATSLADLADQYNKILENKNKAGSMMMDRQKLLRQAQKEMDTLKKKLEEHKSVVDLQSNITEIQNELLWAKVRDAEEELKNFQTSARAVETKYNNFVEDSTKKTQRAENIKETISSLQQQIMEIKEEVELQRGPQNDLKTNLFELKQRLSEKIRMKNTVEHSVSTQERNKASIEHEIANATENLNSAERERLERLRKIAALEEKLGEMENLLQTSRNDFFQFKSDVARKEQEEVHIKSEISEMDRKISNAISSIESLRRSSTNSLALYGREMPQVIQEINRLKSRFKQVPRGPIGSYITLKDKKWAVAVEGYLGQAFLKAFIVDNVQDNIILRDIFKRVYGNGLKPTVFTSKFFSQVHNVSKYLVRPTDGCVSIFDSLVISDPVVANCIIDQRSVERILLIPDTETAINLLSDESRVPRNCLQGITITGDKYYPVPNYRTYGTRYTQARFLQVNAEDRIRQLEEEVGRYTKEKEGYISQCQALRNDTRNLVQSRNALEQKIRNLNDKRGKFRQESNELKSVQEPEAMSVQSLEAELEEIKKGMLQKNVQLEELGKEIEKIKVLMAETSEKLSKYRDTFESLENRIEPLERQIMLERAKESEIKASETVTRNKIKEYNKKLEETRAQVDAKQAETELFDQQASMLCPRMDNIRQVRELVKKMQELESAVRRIQSEIQNPEDIQSRYDVLHAKHTETAEVMHYLSLDLEELKKAVLKRNRHYTATEDYFKMYMQTAFEKVLRFRQFEGHLEIDTERKKLDLVVIPQQGSQGQTTTANLSGGERSFSTVAFLYSLWQCTRFPFYFLDEFDVYMDKLNRTKVVEVLLHHAKMHKESQFVFLTPQDISFIKDECVEILKLEDPERRNGL